MNAELDRILKEQNLFIILNLTSDVSPEDLRVAYKKMLKEVHPDRFTDSDDKTKAEEAFKRVGVAFNTLKDPLMRKDYERSLERMGGASYTPSSRQSTTSSPPSSSSTSSDPVRPPNSSPPGTGPMRPPNSSPPGTGPINQNAQAAAKREQMIAEQAEKHYESGRTFERKNMMEDAIKEYQEAIRLKKGEAKYHSRLGFVLEKKGWGGYAQAEYKVALHFDPTDQLALKSYRPTAGANQSKGAGLKFLNLLRGDKGVRIGDILIQMGHINKEQLQKALKQQNDDKLLLGEILIRMKFIKPEQLAQALIHQGDNNQKQDK